MANWNSSPHPISDIRDWASDGKLIIQPDFQRREVWGLSAQVMLMDTILKQIPMPKIFLSTELKNGKTIRSVIDGQQRIKAILSFLRGEFRLDDSFSADLNGKIFSELPDDVQENFLMYAIDFNEAQNATEEEVRNVYSRVNKYTVALNKQELRKADFPGDFLDLSEKIALHDFLEEIKIFTPTNRRRYGDVEFVSELLVAVIGRIQDKKGYLEEFYKHYAAWDKAEVRKAEAEFTAAFSILEQIFGCGADMSKTRFRQKADFYSLFLAVLDFLRGGLTLAGKDVTDLQSDIGILNQHIRPESEVHLLQEYAIKCVSQANSSSSRRWRKQFLHTILSGTFDPGSISDMQIEVYYRIKSDLDMIAKNPTICACCREEISLESALLGWIETDTNRQISNSVWLNPECSNRSNYIVVARPAAEAPDLFG